MACEGSGSPQRGQPDPQSETRYRTNRHRAQGNERIYFGRYFGESLPVAAGFAINATSRLPQPDIYFLASIFHLSQSSRTPGRFDCQFQKIEFLNPSADSRSISRAKMPQMLAKNNCKDLLIFCLAFPFPKRYFPCVWGVAVTGVLHDEEVPEFLGMSRTSKPTRSRFRHLAFARVAPSFIQNPIASHGPVIPTIWSRRVYV